MITVSLVQPNCRTGGNSFACYWLPYSIGFVDAYSAFGDFQDQLELNQIIFRRENTVTASDNMVGDDIVLFSNFMWNWEYNKELAKELKAKSPDTIIIFGGPEVDENFPERQLKELPYVDILMISEGELSFNKFLHEYTADMQYDKIYSANRVDDLDIPSPYLTDVFKDIIDNNPEIRWSTTLETNRGCPYSCTFCDWGSLTYAKVKKFPVEKVYQEIEWLGANKIQYIFMADANFGIYPERDMAITDYILDVQARTGYPATVNANWHKNAKQNVIEIVKKFISNGFNRGMTLSVQSMDEQVLDIIKRKNMDTSHLGAMMEILNKEGIGSYTELILPLPGETTDTWRTGLTDVLSIGQHNSIEIWFHQLLQNAQSNHIDHKDEYSFSTVKLPDYVMGDPEPDHQQHISEVTEVVTSTSTMDYDEFLDNWMYAWMIINFHCGGWSQLVTRVNNKQGNMVYKTAYNRLYAALVQDNGICGSLYERTRIMLDNYLQNNKLEDGASGHTLFWYANRELHQHHAEVMDFIDEVFNESHPELLKTNRLFVTDINQTYPQTVQTVFNYIDYINNETNYLIPGVHTFNLYTEKNWETPQQYTEWLYFRRRQGFGKAKWRH